MSEYKEINIEELQEIEVRHGIHHEWEKRRLILINSGGSAICVDSNECLKLTT